MTKAAQRKIHRKALRLRALLREAAELHRELVSMPNVQLPLAAAGRGFIEWDQLRWMADSLSKLKEPK